MKHHFLSTAAIKQSRYLPKMQTRRFPGLARHGHVAYKTDGGDPEADEKDPEKKALLTAVRTKVAGELEKRGFTGENNLDSLIKIYLKNEGVDNLRNLAENAGKVVDLAAKLEAIEKRTQIGRPERQKTIAQQMRAAITKDDAAKADWDNFVKRKSNNFRFELRAPAPITIAPVGAPVNSPGNNGNVYVPGFEEIPGLIDLPRNSPFMMAISNVRPLSKPSVVWTEKKNPEGNAAMTAEGTLKSLVDFKYESKREEAKKVTDYIKTSKENLDDIDWMAAEIEKELRYKIEIFVSQQLLSGDGVGNNLNGLDLYAGGYVLTTINTTTPNNTDAIRSAIAQIVSLNFRPNVVVLNPIDMANMELEKAEDGHYILPPFATADKKIVAGVRVMEENEIPVGNVLVGDMTRFQVAVLEGIVIEYGWVDDDFIRNMVTILGEMRLLSFVPDNETGAFVYDTFVNIKSAIAAA